MTMKITEAEKILGLHPPYDEHSIVQAWLEARNRANSEARLSLERRRQLPESLKTIDKAKATCEQALKQQRNTTAPAFGGWASRQKRRPTQRKSAPFFPFTQKTKKGGTSFSQTSSQPPDSFLKRLNVKQTILRSLFLSIPFTIALNLALFLLVRGCSMNNPDPNASMDEFFEGNQSTVTFLSDVPVEVEFINTETGARYRGRTPMVDPISCPAGHYETQVIKDGALWERSHIDIQPGTRYEIPIR